VATKGPSFLSAEACWAHAKVCEREAQSLIANNELRSIWIDVAAQWRRLAKNAEARAKIC
jgi:hypothetical protein